MISIFIKIAVIATVVAVATTGIIVGVIVGVVPTTNEDACATLRAPTDLRIVPANNIVTVSWANSTDDCADHYEILVEMNGGVINETTEVPFHFFEHTAYCTEVQISVTRIAEDGRRSAPASRSYVRSVSAGFGPVKDLTITPTVGNEVLVQWVKPTGFDQCTIKYQVTVGDGMPIDVEELQYAVSLEGLTYCEKTTISVVPVIDGVVGETDWKDTEEVQVLEGFAKVIDLDITPQSANTVLVRWGKPLNFELCTITYKVTVGLDGTPKDVEELETLVSLENAKYCDSIYVVPVINSILGAEDSKNIPVDISEGFAKVADLEITPKPDNKVLVSWGKPLNYELCTITYKVSVGLDGAPEDVEDLETLVSLENAKYCDSIYVVPVINSILGAEESKNIPVDISEGFAKVADLEIIPESDNKVLVRWGKPLNYELCTITYKVSVGLDGTPEDVEDLETLVSIEDAKSCDSIYVVPVINSILGAEDSKNIEVDISEGFAKVTGLEIIPESDNKVLVRWGKPLNYELCTITYKVSVGLDGTPEDVEDLETLVSIEDAKSCDSIYVVPVINTILGAEDSKNIEVDISEGFAKVTGLEIGPESDNKVLVSWGKPLNFELCTITYKVRVGIDGVPEDVEELETLVSLEDAKYCDSIYVVPVINTILGAEDSKNIEVDISEGFAKVTGLEIGPESDNKVLVSWGKPLNFELCTITYKVRVGIDGVPEDVEELETLVSLEDAKYCDSIYVVPVINTILGAEDSKNIEVDISEGFAKVTGLEIGPESDNKVLVSWGKPLNFELCTITYKVRVGIDGVPEDVEELETLVSLEDAKYCDSIYIVPVINTILGAEDSKNIEVDISEGFAKVTGLEIGPESDNKVLVSWGKPLNFELCTITYKVRVGIDGVPEDVEELETLVSLEDAKYCDSIYVVPVINTILGAEDSKNIEVDISEGFAKVTGLEIGPESDNKVLVSWGKPLNFELCTITYKVRVGIDGVPEDVEELETLVSLEDAKYCDSIYVVPVINTILGAEDSKNIEVDISEGFAKVTGLEIGPESDNKVLVSWGKPLNFELCTITYKVRVGIDGVPEDVEELETLVSLEDAKYCDSIYVVPVINTILGAEDSKNIEVDISEGFAKVTGLEIGPESDNKVLVSWGKPLNFELCTITYKVRVGIDGVPEDVEELETLVSLEDAKYCDSIYIVPVINTILGAEDSKNIEVDISDGFAKVTGLEIGPESDDKVLVSWGKPLNFELCTITYKVRVGIDGVPEDVEELETLVSLEDAKYCDSIYVVPVINTILGAEDSKNIEVDISDGFAKVTGLEIGPESDNKVLVSWGKPLNYELCTITYKVSVGLDGTPDDVEDLETLVSLEDVKYCDSIYVVPVINTVEGSPDAVSAEKYPGTIGPVTDLATSIEGTTFKAIWTEPTGLELCTFIYDVELKEDSVPPVTDTTDKTEWEREVAFNCPVNGLEFTVVAKHAATIGDSALNTNPCSDYSSD